MLNPFKSAYNNFHKESSTRLGSKYASVKAHSIQTALSLSQKAKTSVQGRNG